MKKLGRFVFLLIRVYGNALFATDYQFVDPLVLLSPHRFSVMAKYIFAKHMDLEIQSTWGYNLYYRHLLVWNNLKEQTNAHTLPSKEGIDQFVGAFCNTLQSIKRKGFDPAQSKIWYGYDERYGGLSHYRPVDGEHRIASCLLFNKPVAIKKIEKINRSFSYSSRFFKNRKLDAKYLDAMATEYATLKNNTYMVFVFPQSYAHLKKIELLLEHYGATVYDKNIPLTDKGKFNLIRMLYGNETWIGNWNNKFSGIQNKMKCVFPPEAPHRVTVYLWECASSSIAKECKQKIRDLVRIGHHSVHINDNHEETIMYAQMMFNNNSVNWLNKAQLKLCEKFELFFNQYKDWLTQKNYAIDHFCIDGSAVLSVYGLRDCNDIDFLHYGNSIIHSGNNNLSDHEGELKYHCTNKDNIIFNPENFFYYKTIKFVSPDILKKMKLKRNEDKDIQDIQLMDKICS
jgi:hypothetical protein